MGCPAPRQKRNHQQKCEARMWPGRREPCSPTSAARLHLLSFWAGRNGDPAQPAPPLPATAPRVEGWPRDGACGRFGKGKGSGGGVEGWFPDTWGHKVFFSLPTLNQHCLGLPPDFSPRETWRIRGAYHSSWTPLNSSAENSPFDGGGGPENSVQGLVGEAAGGRPAVRGSEGHVLPDVPLPFSLGNQDRRVDELVSWASRPLECPPQICQWGRPFPWAWRGHGHSWERSSLALPCSCFPEAAGGILLLLLVCTSVPLVPIFPATSPPLAQGCSSPAPAQGFPSPQGPLALDEGALECAGCPLLSCAPTSIPGLGRSRGRGPSVFLCSSKTWFAHPLGGRGVAGFSGAHRACLRTLPATSRQRASPRVEEGTEEEQPLQSAWGPPRPVAAQWADPQCMQVSDGGLQALARVLSGLVDGRELFTKLILGALGVRSRADSEVSETEDKVFPSSSSLTSNQDYSVLGLGLLPVLNLNRRQPE
ncbi:hypothetical protein MC885_003801 [Smutsia gigantea]|nr:hypothetical protein MC885_003801 [Smutsia gigantea]